MAENDAAGRPIAFSEEDLAAHREHDHVAAVFPDREHAAEAVDELRELGLGSEHLGIAVHGDQSIVFEHDEDDELIRDTAKGAVAGTSIGAIAGIGLVVAAASGVGAIGVGGMFAIAGASALWGGLLGAYSGATIGDRGWTAHEDLAYTALEPGEVLVVVCSHGHGDSVRDTLGRHAGRMHTISPDQLAAD